MDQLNVFSCSIATEQDVGKWPQLRDVDRTTQHWRGLTAHWRWCAWSLVGVGWKARKQRRALRYRVTLGWTVMRPTDRIKDEETSFNVNSVRIDNVQRTENDLFLWEKVWKTDFGGSVSEPKVLRQSKTRTPSEWWKAQSRWLMNIALETADSVHPKQPPMAERRLYILKGRLLRLAG